MKSWWRQTVRLYIAYDINMIFLETDRLLLRNVIIDDVDIMFDYRNNEICSRYQRGQT